MGERCKFVLTKDGRLDLSTHRWDDNRFTDLLTRGQAVNTDTAMSISRHLREELDRIDTRTINLSAIEKMIDEKLQEFGLDPSDPVRLDGSIFKKKGPILSGNAKTVLERRYLKKDPKGKIIESPDKMFRRVARHIAKAEKQYGNEERIEEIEDAFYDLMTEFRFLPNSPTLMNAGRRLGQLAACFVLPIEDSMEGIFTSLHNSALIHKSGGGTGFSFSRLRPKDSRVGTTGGVASGPVSFMKIFNTATEQVKQGGTRRGANMAILRVDHPDILEFIHCKKEDGTLNNFNISVGVTGAFMRAVAEGREYELIDPRDGSAVDSLDAREVYTTLVEQAWDNGDPGIIFLDRLNDDNPTPGLGEIESTNPCGEQPLLPNEACNLGSINLSKFVIEEGGTPVIDYDELKETVHLAVRFLDNTIDRSRYPLPEIDAMVKDNRKIGLGVMGFADMLYQLNIPYNSEPALKTAESVMGAIQKAAREASHKLAVERGAFPNCDQSIYQNHPDGPLRNATTTTIAPTGTLSIIAGCSSGIEPLFALSFVRTVMDNDRLMEVNPHFAATAREGGFYSDELMNEIAARGSIHSMENIPPEIRKIYVTAHDVTPEWHIRMQAAFQKYTDNAVSKTVNLPRDATVEDVHKIYDLAYELSCKGVTIYRDGSKENQVLSFKQQEDPQSRFLRAVKERPDTLEGFTTKMKTGMGHLYVTVTEYEDRPFEVFATIGKSGRSTAAKAEAVGRLVSLALRAGVKVADIVKQLKGIGGEYPVFQPGGLVLSIPDAVARVLEKRYMIDTKAAADGFAQSLLGEKCPECSQTISFEEGCMTCHFCGFTKCG
ncbi:MAG: vitamin B12-dependent ribonucleotide reductase [Desulfobacterales bacterium]|nr:vitamin B12-dependent ribonucleotide reductase [Desulfobacterales bacterium]MDJ0875448.1 vitamin B12-dependent ribonucleotide reductase [Desulfobacterales bacterium]MDJ0885631.1 vitamin B12-dependent ribonucleotide reductase [Desulfobacterales bacterium]